MSVTSWIQAHSDLNDHPKTMITALALGIDRDTLAGKLLRLWNWALINHSDGIIPKYEAVLIRDCMRVETPVDSLINALLLCPRGERHGFLYTTKDSYILTNWDQYSSHYNKWKSKREYDRKYHQEKRKKEVMQPENVVRQSDDNRMEIVSESAHNITIPRNKKSTAERAGVREGENGVETELSTSYPQHNSNNDEVYAIAMEYAKKRYEQGRLSNPAGYVYTLVKNWSEQGLTTAQAVRASQKAYIESGGEPDKYPAYFVGGE